jgi:ribosome-associated toxin RatA of RatAB toxin-antitoxin module
MATIHNEIIVNASLDKVWGILTDLELLDKYDPTVRKSTLVSAEKRGIGAKRKVDMLDGKNWFEEKVSVFKPNKSLTYELTACSFPIHQLKHSYSFEKLGTTQG